MQKLIQSNKQCSNRAQGHSLTFHQGLNLLQSQAISVYYIITLLWSLSFLHRWAIKGLILILFFSLYSERNDSRHVSVAWSISCRMGGILRVYYGLFFWIPFDLHVPWLWSTLPQFVCLFCVMCVPFWWPEMAGSSVILHSQFSWLPICCSINRNYSKVSVAFLFSHIYLLLTMKFQLHIWLIFYCFRYPWKVRKAWPMHKYTYINK